MYGPPTLSLPPSGLSEEELTAATQAQIAHLPSPMEPVLVGLCNGLQQHMLASRSKALLAALQVSQGLWQPRSPPSSRQAALEQLVQEGLLVVQELQVQLQKRGRALGEKGHLLGTQPRSKFRYLQHFLLEEAGSFLALLQQVDKDLHCTQERLKGTSCSSTRCIAILRSLEQDRLPHPWLLHTPTGPQPPKAWLQMLQRRCQLLCSYLETTGATRVPHYNLATFQHPRRLLVALLREEAREKKQELERYELVQEVRRSKWGLGTPVLPVGDPDKATWSLLQILPTLQLPSSAPDEGLYLSGLVLHHALWNPRSGQIQETLSAEACKLPVVWVQAKRKHMKMASAPAPSMYHCPVYLGTPEMPVSLHSHRVILHVPLPSKMALQLCAQQRVHIVNLLQ